MSRATTRIYQFKLMQRGLPTSHNSRADEWPAGRVTLVREDVEPGTGEVAGVECVEESLLVDAPRATLTSRLPGHIAASAARSTIGVHPSSLLAVTIVALADARASCRRSLLLAPAAA